MEKKGSQLQSLLEMIALSGEYSVAAVERLLPKEAYRRKIITKGKNDKLLNTIYINKLRGYRLTSKAKKTLLGENRERFAHSLEGDVETNRVQSDITRRKRLQSMADVLTTMYRSDVEIFADKKPLIFSQSSQPLAVDEQKPLRVKKPMFYLSREIKKTDERWLSFRGSSAAGVLLGANGAWVVYNTGDAQVQWRDRIEARIQAEMQSFLYWNVLSSQYKGADIGGIMLGSDIETLERCLTEPGGKQNGLKFLTSSYKSFYYFTNNEFGELQLRLLTDTERWAAVEKVLSEDKGMEPTPAHYSIECDGMTPDGRPVLNCCLLNVPRLVKYQSGLDLQDKYGLVYCFDFQKEFIGRYLGERAELKDVSYEKLKEKLYPDI